MKSFWMIPTIGFSASSRDAIISLLSNEWPLSAKQIYQKVSKGNQKPISYQAIHKTLNQLVSLKVISKKGTSYQLDKEWIQQLKAFGQQVDHQYSNETGKLKLPKDLNQPAQIEFKDVSSLGVTLASLFTSKTLTNGETQPVYGLFQHGIWPLRFNFLDVELLAKMAKNSPGYAAIIGDLPFDRWIAKHYVAGGLTKAKSGVKENISEDVLVHGDVVVQIHFEPETIKFIEELYSKMHTLSDLFNFYLGKKISDHQYRATVTIQRNPLLAKLMREKIEKLLEEKR